MPPEYRSVSVRVRNTSTYYRPYLYWLLVDVALTFAAAAALSLITDPPGSFGDLDLARKYELFVFLLLGIANVFAYYGDL